jgi:hypothetical protein
MPLLNCSSRVLRPRCCGCGRVLGACAPRAAELLQTSSNKHKRQLLLLLRVHHSGGSRFVWPRCF